MPHILVVDDDERIRDLVCRYLLEHGFIVIPAADAYEAETLLETMSVDAAVVDVMMPGKTGLEFTADLQGKKNVPVLLLTALGEVDDRIAGLEAGADDYLAKPFEPKELVLRLRALLKRTMPEPVEGKILVMGEREFHVSEGLLKAADGGLIPLTDAETDLLVTFAKKTGAVFSRDELALACDVSSVRAIDVQITRLRRKIEDDSKNARYLQTVRGQGYLLRVDEVRRGS